MCDTTGQQRSATMIEAPEYFPPLDFCAGMLCSDRVVLDVGLQYSRQSFHNRARICTPQGPMWLSVPVHGGQFGSSLAETRVDNRKDWRRKHLQSLRFNYRSTPYFDFLEPELEEFFAVERETIGEIAAVATGLLAEMFGLSSDVQVANTTIPEGLEEAEHRHERPVRSIIMARGIHDGDSNARIVEFADRAYRQSFEGYHEGMSGLDLVFNYGPEAIAELRTRTTIR